MEVFPVVNTAHVLHGKNIDARENIRRHRSRNSKSLPTLRCYRTLFLVHSAAISTSQRRATLPVFPHLQRRRNPEARATQRASVIAECVPLPQRYPIASVHRPRSTLKGWSDWVPPALVRKEKHCTLLCVPGTVLGSKLLDCQCSNYMYLISR